MEDVHVFEGVTTVGSDNHPNISLIFREYLKPLLPNAHHQRCVAHILNLVGGDLLSSQILAAVHKLQTLVRSFIKGKPR